MFGKSFVFNFCINDAFIFNLCFDLCYGLQVELLIFRDIDPKMDNWD